MIRKLFLRFRGVRILTRIGLLSSWFVSREERRFKSLYLTSLHVTGSTSWAVANKLLCIEITSEAATSDPPCFAPTPENHGGTRFQMTPSAVLASAESQSTNVLKVMARAY